ncbi:MAG: diguanylate cyclase [Gemmatimonadales bacterium]
MRATATQTLTLVLDRRASKPARSVPRLRILLVEDNPIDAMRIRQLLARAKSVAFEVDSVANLDHATRHLGRQTPDLILLDLDLPDSVGADTHATMACAAPTIPIIVLCRGADEGLGIASVAQGAQDYVMKHSVSAEGLARSIRCAVERQRVVAALRGLTLTDELTGLLNRRGFTTLAHGHLRLAGRTGQRFLLFFADVDGLKAINDQHGHHQGDEALVRAAEALRRTFRQSDVVARYGGDEFAVLALDTSADRGASILRRLAESIDADNERHPPEYRLDLSVGTVSLDGAREEALGALLVKADAALYREKRRRLASQAAAGGGSGS